MSNASSILAVAVVDAHPRFYCEAALWLSCIRRNSTFRPAILFINGAPPNLASFAEECGALVEYASGLFPESPHCNKIIPYHVFEGEDILVTDCDVFVVRDFNFMLSAEHVRLPQNNHGNPPMTVFERILTAAGFEAPFEPGLALFKGASRETFARNVSCGVIWIPQHAKGLVQAWEYWAGWLIANRDVMGDYRVHVDQVGLALALHDLGSSFEYLPAQTNAVLQLLPEIESVYALHLTSGHIPRFSDWFETGGLLNIDLINPRLRSDINRFNETLSEVAPLIAAWDETCEFAVNFLNPAWVRENP